MKQTKLDWRDRLVAGERVRDLQGAMEQLLVALESCEDLSRVRFRLPPRQAAALRRALLRTESELLTDEAEVLLSEAAHVTAAGCAGLNEHSVPLRAVAHLLSRWVDVRDGERV